MSQSYINSLVVAVSSSALFDCETKKESSEENEIRDSSSFFVEQEKEILRPGPGYQLIKALLRINSMMLEEKKI